MPLFPLGTVLFPGLVLPLNVFEPRYRALVEDLRALPPQTPREFGVVAIQRGWEVADATRDGGSASASVTLHEVGCSAELRRTAEMPDGRYEIVTVGRRRFRITAVDPGSAPYLRAEVEWLPEQVGEPGTADRLAAGTLAAFQRYLRLVRTTAGGGEQLPEDPTILSYLVAATTTLAVEDRQSLLAAPDTVSRLRQELRLLARESTLVTEIRAVPMAPSELPAPASPN